MYVQRPLKVCRRSFAFLTVFTAAYLLAAAPAFSAQPTRGIGLVPPDPQANDGFGLSVAISGDTAIIEYLSRGEGDAG